MKRKENNLEISRRVIFFKIRKHIRRIVIISIWIANPFFNSTSQFYREITLESIWDTIASNSYFIGESF